MNICRFPSLLRLNKLYQQQNAIKIALSGKNLNLKYNNNIILNRYISTLDAKPINKEDGLIQKAIKKITFAAVDKVRIKGSAYFLYEGIVDTINYLQFFEELDLPDTFYSWFVITELHIWMLSVRAMAEGQDGRHLRNCLVEALWADVAQRVKKIGVSSTAEMRDQIFELSEQLQAALLAYDEGIQSDDVVLAGAIWRRIFQQKNVDVKDVEKMVKFIRKQITLLDNYSKDQIFQEKRIKWEPLK